MIQHKKVIRWNSEKNTRLKHERGISFELIASLITQGKMLDVIQNSNYFNQRIFIFDINSYIVCVPFVETEDEIFLKTLFKSRKMNAIYKEKTYEEKN